MTPYFSTPERIAKLRAMVTAWIGTPFIFRAAICQGGADCVQFAAAVMRDCGQIQGWTFPPYSLDGGSHLGRSMIVDWLERDGRFARVDDGPIAGDILLFRVNEGDVDHHVGIALSGDEFASALQRYGVKTRTLRERTWGQRLRAIYRPTEGIT